MPASTPAPCTRASCTHTNGEPTFFYWLFFSSLHVTSPNSPDTVGFKSAVTRTLSLSMLLALLRRVCPSCGSSMGCLARRTVLRHFARPWPGTPAINEGHVGACRAACARSGSRRQKSSALDAAAAPPVSSGDALLAASRDRGAAERRRRRAEGRAARQGPAGQGTARARRVARGEPDLPTVLASQLS